MTGEENFYAGNYGSHGWAQQGFFINFWHTLGAFKTIIKW